MPNVDPAAFPNRIEIFRAGRHVDSSGRELHFSAADIAQIASGYNPALSEAPIVVGHPTLNGPAYGWAKQLHADGDRLLAEPHQVEAQFAELHAEGRFKKKSASLFHPDSPGNPTPGQWYLRHIGFLGAQPPAVKGLRDAQFAAADAILVEFMSPIDSTRWALGTARRMFSRLRDYLVEAVGAERAQQVIPDFDLDALGTDIAGIKTGDDINPVPAFSEAAPAITTPVQDDPMPDSHFAEREAALAAREAAVAESERQAREIAAAAARTEAVSFAESLIKDGRLKPARKEAVVELLVSQPAVTIDFAEAAGGPKAPGALLRELLAEAPPVIDFSERSAPSGAGNGHVADFAAPAGALMSGDRLELHRKALAYMAAHPNTPYITAVAAVGG